jgi:hypothetical protein
VALGTIRCLFLSLGIQDHVRRPDRDFGGSATLEIKGPEQMSFLHVDTTAQQVLDGTAMALAPLLTARFVLKSLSTSITCFFSVLSQGRYGSKCFADVVGTILLQIPLIAW